MTLCGAVTAAGATVGATSGALSAASDKDNKIERRRVRGARGAPRRALGMNLLLRGLVGTSNGAAPELPRRRPFAHHPLQRAQDRRATGLARAPASSAQRDAPSLRTAMHRFRAAGHRTQWARAHVPASPRPSPATPATRARQPAAARWAPAPLIP